MPSQHPGETPPEVPEQFRDAYRRAYEEALSAASPATEPVGAAPGEQVTSTEYRTALPRWVFPVAVVLGALVLVACAYVLGRMVSGDEDQAAPAASASAQPTPSGNPDPTPTQTPAPSPTAPTTSTASGEAWDGEVVAVAASSATARCTAKPGVDSGGATVRYDADNMIDGQTDTAWRCQGKATGQQVVFTLPTGTELAEVGLIPGYAKTDDTSGVDRYAENNRITGVTWILADGTEVEQALSPDPKDRSLRTIRVPATVGDTVTLRIDAVQKGKRNTTMVSEVSFASATR